MSGGAHGSHGSVDIFRKLAIVSVLVGTLVWLNGFVTPSPELEPRGLLALGFVILAAYTVGELAEVVKLPHITGYLLAGLVLGPSTAHVMHDAFPSVHLPPPFDEGVLNEKVKHQLLLLDDLALALIALTAGGELKLEQLRKGIRRIIGISTSQVLIVGSSVAVLVWLISGVIPGFGLEQLQGIGTPAALALGAVVGSISLATSPAATIAVINSTGAKGETTETVLSVVVLKDVLVVMAFSAATAVAVGVLGLSSGEGGFLTSLGHIAWSIVVGGGIGFLLHLYLRYVDAEILIFLIGLIYAATYLGHAYHLEAALMFITAGFVTANFSDTGDHLIHEVERLSLPVYVVFFTLAGAKLHLDVLWGMAGFALALVLVRMGSLYISTRAGALVGGGGQSLQRYGWMGFVSQAGLAITLANSMTHTYPGAIGEGLFALVLGGVAINEMVGPVMLQFGLTLAGDTRDAQEPEEELIPRDTTEDVDGSDPFGPPLVTGIAALDEPLADLEHELRALVDDFQSGPIHRSREEFESYIHDLRLDVLRGHRRASIAAQTAEMDELPRAFLDEVAALGAAWRDRVLDRAARARAESWSPGELVGVLDALVSDLPESIAAPVEPKSMEPREERAFMRARRAFLRLRVRLGSKREIILRSLARYHLGGRGPARLEGVAALLIHEQGQLADRTSNLFAVVARSWERAAELVAAGDLSREELLEKLQAMRTDLDLDFDAMSQDVDGAFAEGARRVEVVVGHLMRDLKTDVRQIGTMDLPYRRRRFSLVYADRNNGLRALTTELAGARRTVGARMAAVALELELVALEGRIQSAVDEAGDHIERNFRGRGPLQLDRVHSALGDWLAAVTEYLDAESESVSDGMLLIREQSETLERVVRDAHRSAQQLKSEFASEEATGPLARALLEEVQSLTDWYTIPSGRVADGDWSLPPEVATVEVPFRELTVAYVESNVALELANRAYQLSDQVGQIIDHLEETQRVILFNVELSLSELAVLPPDEPIPAETRELVREMLLGAIGRSRNRLHRMGEECEPWPREGREAIRSAVMVGVEELRAQVSEGGLSDLRRRLLGNRVGSRILKGQDLGTIVRGTREQLVAMALAALGEDRVESLRQVLGLPRTELGERELRDALAAPKPTVELPVVYRRLFSDRALEAGDLIVGRDEEIERARDALRPGRLLRSVAIVGVRGSGANSLAAGVARSWGGKIRRIILDKPVSVSEVERWFSDPAPNTLTVLVGIRWMYELRPGGFRPLERFAELLVASPSSMAWIVPADTEVWRTVCRVASLDKALGAVVELDSLSVENLMTAVLARHRMSGYDLEFDAADDVGWQLWHLVLRGTEGEARQRLAWFQTLHEACGGVMHDGLRMWLAAIREVDEENGLIRIGSVKRPPVARLFGLDDAVLLTLVQALRQGWIDATMHASLFRARPADSQVHLVSLAHRGLLKPREDGRFEVPRHLRNPIDRALQARGWT